MTTAPILTMPNRPLCPLPGQKANRYTPAVATDIRKTFDKYRRLIALQNKQ